MRDARVLVVDDDPAELQRCLTALSEIPGVEAEGTTRSTEALTRLGNESFDLLVTDLRMPVVDGMDLLRVASAHDPDLPVLVLTGFPSVDTALATLKAGADDYLTKPVHPGELVAVVERLLEGRRLRREHSLLERRLGLGDQADLIGASPSMVRVLDMVRRLAASDLDVLIVGETGTGKELVARRVHALSPRPGRFVPVDCGAIPESLVESELYGHEKGAFTGADRRSMGLLEYADGGTFFLDEVQALPLGLQAKLLRSLQERRFRRVGATQELQVNVRVVAALNEDPADLVRLGRLREDLHHRLNVGRVDLPPLRERKGDVRLLVGHFFDRYRGDGAHAVQALSEEAMALLEAYAWPGNVRELQNVLRRSLALAHGDVLTPEDLPDTVRGAGTGPASAELGPFTAARDRYLADFERGYLRDALRAGHGDVSEVSRRTGISRATLYRMLKRHGIDPDSFRS